MAIIANSTISENPIGVESIKSPDSDLKLQARVAVSRTSIIQDTAGLSFGNSILENAISRNFVETASLPGLAASDTVSVVRSYSEDPTVQQLSLGRTDVVVANYEVIDSASLRLVAFERPDDDEPSELWREYTGLPIQPIGYSPIASEQFDINFRSFSDVAEGSLEISAEDQIQVILNSIDSSLLSASDDAKFSSTNVYEDQGDLGFFGLVSKVIYLNSDETGLLEIDANDLVQQIFSFSEVGSLGIDSEFATSTSLNSFDTTNANIGLDFTFNTTLNSFDQAPFEISDDALQSSLLNSIDQVNTSVTGFDQLSMSYFSFENGIATIQGKTFAKEYTFLQQEFDIANIRLNISARSNEAYVEARDGVTTVSRQIWIG
jgi:hypothetical protein